MRNKSRHPRIADFVSEHKRPYIKLNLTQLSLGHTFVDFSFSDLIQYALHRSIGSEYNFFHRLDEHVLPCLEMCRFDRFYYFLWSTLEDRDKALKEYVQTLKQYDKHIEKLSTELDDKKNSSEKRKPVYCSCSFKECVC